MFNFPTFFFPFHINKLYTISKCVEVYEESCTSVKRSFLITIKFWAMSQTRIIYHLISLLCLNTLLFLIVVNSFKSHLPSMIWESTTGVVKAEQQITNIQIVLTTCCELIDDGPVPVRGMTPHTGRLSRRPISSKTPERALKSSSSLRWKNSLNNPWTKIS